MFTTVKYPKQRFDDDVTDSDASIPEDRGATVLGGPTITGPELVDLMRHISVAQEFTSNSEVFAEQVANTHNHLKLQE